MNPTQHHNRPELEAHQLDCLRRLLTQLVPANRFYASKIQSAGLGPDLPSLEEFSTKMPFTTKQQLVEDQQAHPPYGSNLTYSLDRYTRFNQTSATTGTPLRWLDTPDGWSWMLENWQRVFAAAGVAAGDRVYFAFSFGPFLGFWTAFEAAERMGCLCLPGGGLSSAQRLRAMIDNEIQVLCCTPTYAIRLAEVAYEEGISLDAAQVKTIIVAGEPGANIPKVRSLLETSWGGAKIFDHHGMTEVGPVSFEAPTRPGTLQIIESSYLVEVLDTNTHQPVALGETGELILTTLGRGGSPLLRYRTGDMVRPIHLPRDDGEGYDLGLDGGILGRTDDMLIVRGVNIFPSAIEDVICSVEGVAEFRVEVRTEQPMTEMSILIEPAPACENNEALVAKLKKDLKAAFPLRIDIKTVPCGSLPRFEMKAKRWVKVSSAT